MLKNRIPYFVIIVISLLISCVNNDGGYEQKYPTYTQYSKINGRNKCWFLDTLLKNDAFDIRNESFLATKCVFGIFSYRNEELYNSIFTNDAYLEPAVYAIFVSQLESTKNIIPE